jgi:hypothetical protein
MCICPHLFRDSTAEPNPFSIDSLQACLSTILSHLERKEGSFGPSFREPSSLLDIPAMLFVGKTYEISKYVCITSLYYHPVDANLG